MIKLSNISKSYGRRNVLNGVSLEVSKGDSVSIMGESGSGKSTLLNILGTLDQRYAGEYLYKGNTITPKTAVRFRNETIGFIFQQYHLIPTLSAMENILMPYCYCKTKYQDLRGRAESLLESFGMGGSVMQSVNTLSGGEQQRIALIRSIILDPEIIIADEPTGNLDRRNADFVEDFLFEQNKRGKAIVVVTHDERLARKFASQYELLSGRLHERQQAF